MMSGKRKRLTRNELVRNALKMGATYAIFTDKMAVFVSPSGREVRVFDKYYPNGKVKNG